MQYHETRRCVLKFHRVIVRSEMPACDRAWSYQVSEIVGVPCCEGRTDTGQPPSLTPVLWFEMFRFFFLLVYVQEFCDAMPSE